MREAPSTVVIRELLKRGARLQAYDPVAMEEARRVMTADGSALPEGLSYVPKAMAALEGAHALVLVTEWKEFRTPDFEALAAALGDKLVFDGRNVYEPEVMRSFGLRYVSIGRPGSEPTPGARSS